MSARPTRQHFLNRAQDQGAVPRHLPPRRNGNKWSFSQSALFLDFLAGNQSYHCTPWGNPTRNYFGWQRPCYLLGEGYAKTFKELMESTDWDAYGTGNYEKCADCMVHSGYRGDRGHGRREASARRRLGVALRGVKTEGEMAPEIPLDKQRPARIRVLAPCRERARDHQEPEAR